MTNEEKAREICGCGNCHHNFKGNECLKYTGILCCLKSSFEATLEAMKWKEKQIFNLLRSKVLSTHLHGGEIDEVLAELDMKLKGE